MRPALFTALAAAVLLTGCASREEKAWRKEEQERKAANSRWVEEAKMRDLARYSADGITERGVEALSTNPDKTFDPRVARFGRDSVIAGQSARTNEFYFKDRVRSKDYRTRDYGTKKAWVRDSEYETKAARTKESWFSV